VKIMGIEEHFVTAGIRAAWAASPIGQEGTGGFDRGEIEERLDDLGEQRLALMDESGVDVQVLSVTTPALHNLEPEESVTLARRTNDLIAATIAKYRTRFQGFATLPTAAPKEAAAELERAVTRLGLVGPCCAVAHARRTWIIQTSYHYFRPPRDLAFLCLCTLRYRNAPSGRFTTQVSAT
jgi:predicted TIM-barrel fold metal-dependent hydrolase